MNHNPAKPRNARNTSKRINPAHFSEWVEGSGVDPEITKCSLISLNDRTVVASRIGWKKYSDAYDLGWFASGLDLRTMQPHAFGQFKPDTAIQFPEKDKPTKYLSDKGHPYDAIALRHPEGVQYWQRVLDDVSIIVDLDEGTKKAGAGMTCGFPSLALCGVTMWQIKGELVPNLAAVAVPGRTIRIRFDMDVLTKKEVRHEIKKLVKALEKRDCKVLVARWNPELGLKIDDVLVKHGPEMVKKIMADAVPYAQWLKDLEARINSIAETPDTGSSTAKKPPSPRQIAARIAEQYGHQIKYDDEQQTWRKDSGRHWEKMSLGAFGSWLKTTLDAKNIPYTGSAYIEDVRKLLEHDLRQLKWQFWDKSRYVNFSNCVFDAATAKTLDYTPGMGFTSYLPYEYKTLKGDLGDSLAALCVNCPKIYQFFYEAMGGDKRKMFKLLAIINALLKHRFFDLQMFVHLVGAPGSGKGKFARFCQKLVGKDNTVACQLEKLTDGSTKASVIDKQLVVFPDERKPVGIDSILSLTGGDEISYRELYQPAASAHFYGSLLICSNKPIFIGDTTGLERRLCLVGFDNPIATDKRDHSLEEALESEIPACIAIALSLADSAVTQAIRGKGADQIIEYKAKEWDMKVEVNSVAAFLDSALVFDSTATTTTGNLYDAYKEFCEVGGLSKFSITKFPRLLADILTDEDLPATRHQGRIAYFKGLRLRNKSDIQPTHSETLAGLSGTLAGLSGTLAGLGAGLEPLPDIHQRDLRDLDTKLPHGNENNFLPSCEKNDDLERDLPLSSPASPANPLTVPNTSPAQVPHKSRTTPASGVNHKEFKEGDRVVIVEPRNLHEGQQGKVVHVGYGSRETDYLIRLDKKSHNLNEVTVTVPKGSKLTLLMKL